MVPQPSTSPPSIPTSLLARRRSQSRSTSSSGGGSYRSSLGGKSIGPKYSALTSARRGSEQLGVGQQEEGNSRVSLSSDAGASSSDGGLGRFGSFSATREELRDGELRLRSSLRRALEEAVDV